MVNQILIVDDDDLAIANLKAIFTDYPEIQFLTAGDSSQALQILAASSKAVVLCILDYQMPNVTGAELASVIRSRYEDILIAINSGDQSREALKACYEAGVVDFLEKDLNPAVVRERIFSLLKKYEETRSPYKAESSTEEKVKLIKSLGMAGCSNALYMLAQTVHQTASKDSTVLIQGESGTGKEVIARAIHNISPRREHPFVAINMGALPEHLVESELFGFEKGAFTGADKSKVGLFKLADKGTLFLDEIGDLKPHLQVKVLRALQERTIHPVGATKPIPINVRIVAATHVNLETAIEEGKFREDLYYRLNVINLRIPSLRERPEDIVPLVEHFQKKFGGETKVILQKTFKYLEKYSWRGNIRELENEMEKLMTIIPAQKIEPSHLSAKIFNGFGATGMHEFDCTYEEFQNRQEESEKKYFWHNISKSRSCREAAITKMKMNPVTLHWRMKKLGLNGEEKNEEITHHI